ncbi:hypothetical protein L7F22_057048 [Adiantum nelumboides]|nr:hypothetical protein [Adiantum nelumboides]
MVLQVPYISQGYKRSDIDHCLYTKQALDGRLLIFILFVDDMLFAEKNTDELAALQSKLKDNFDMKDLDDANQILEIWIVQNRDKWLLYLSQTKYIEKVLGDKHMQQVKIYRDDNPGDLHSNLCIVKHLWL